MFGLITRRQHTAKLADAYTEIQRLRQERDSARDGRDTAVRNRRQVLGQLAEADAANRRLAGRNLELGVRLSAYAESDPEYLTGLEQRLARALRAVARSRAAHAAETRRADLLQARLDDSLGLNTSGVLDGRRWQQTRQDRKGVTA